MNPKAPQEALAAVLTRILERSRDLRAQYDEDMRAAARHEPARSALSCSNLAHVFAAMEGDKSALKNLIAPNLGVVTAYNDMLSAHQPFETYPALIRGFAREFKATAQVAGGVPAMCDGVTQGQPGMELSLFSRDVIALATGVALSHDAFDAAILLGVCDKIVPGLFIAAARFGHLPIAFAPAGPMGSGIPNPEKAKVRKRFAAGEASREELLEAEAQSYHSAGTCNFYGTANTNQLALEAMGMMAPGAAFVAPSTPLRDALTRQAVRLALSATATGGAYRPFAAIADARAIVNGMVGLLASGGSTNHALHFVAMARACGLVVDWQDLSALSAATPLLARIYPNGSADVNHFQAAGGTQFLIRELLNAGLMFEDVETLAGRGLRAYTHDPHLLDGELNYRPCPQTSLDLTVLRPASDPFDQEGGLRLVSGNLGRAIVKVSAVPPQARRIEAPAIVFNDQSALSAAFKRGELDGRDFVAVVRFQGPRANGMPELHSLTPPLGVLQDRGAKVALVTDGRMSGASGSILAAIHVTPEAIGGGPLAKVRTGDLLCIDPAAGLLEARVPGDHWNARDADARPDVRHRGSGRDLFALFRQNAADAELGGGPLHWE